MARTPRDRREVDLQILPQFATAVPPRVTMPETASTSSQHASSASAQESHMEIVRRQKKSQENGGGSAIGSGGESGEGFFYGGFCHMAELQECGPHHNSV